jgi:hypothetical protein
MSHALVQRVSNEIRVSRIVLDDKNPNAAMHCVFRRPSPRAL